MSLMLHVALVVHSLFLLNALPCELWEYRIGGDCCPKCGTGFRVLRHCTSASSTDCVSCNPGWFTEHPNGLTMCLKCRECPAANHMQVRERCHYSQNAKCTCQAGFFCNHRLEADSCDVCMRHKIAPAGFRVTQAGTENHDVEFEPCPQGTFSSKEMSFSCINWTNCSEKGLLQAREGNATSDVLCESPPQSNRGLILPLASTGVIFLLLVLLLSYLLWKKWPWEATDKKKAEEPHYMGPEKDCMMKPIQETVPNLGEPCYAKC